MPNPPGLPRATAIVRSHVGSIRLAHTDSAGDAQGEARSIVATTSAAQRHAGAEPAHFAQRRAGARTGEHDARSRDREQNDSQRRKRTCGKRREWDGSDKHTESLLVSLFLNSKEKSLRISR